MCVCVCVGRGGVINFLSPIWGGMGSKNISGETGVS